MPFTAMRRLAAVGSLVTLAGCANHDFGSVRTLDGRYDRDSLVADLAEGEDDALIDWRWIPLVRTRIELFAETPVDGGFPSGHELLVVYGYAPLFFWGDARVLHFDRSGELFDEIRETSVAWGLVQLRETRVDTPRGLRVESGWSALLGLLQDESVRYEAESPLTAPAEELP